MSDIAITFAILLAVVLAFVSNRIPVGLVAIGASLALYFTGVLDLTQALAGFGDPAVIFIATLFVVSEGLDATGVTTWAGQQLIARVGDSRTRLIVLMMLLVAGLTALISVNGAVAALLPVIVVIAVRLGRSPSQLLMPLVFGAHAGSMLALTGTPVNVIVNEAAPSTRRPRLRVLRVRARRRPAGHRHDRDRPARSASGCSRRGRPAASRPTSAGTPGRSSTSTGSTTRPSSADRAARSGLAEVVVPPRSAFVGDTVFPGMVTDSGDLVVVAIQRKGEDQGPGEAMLAVGDVLLLQGSWTALDENLADPDLLVVDAPELIRRQVVPLGLGAQRGDRRPGRRWWSCSATGDRPVGRRRPARRGRDGPAPGRLRRRRLPRDQLDDGRPGGRDDPALDGDDRRPAPPTSSRTRWSASCGAPGRTRCWPGCSSSPR